MPETLFVWLQYLLPQHALSRLMNRFTRLRVEWLKNAFTRWFIGHFNINMAEAQVSDYRLYPDFNSFFTRALKPGARPLDTAEDAVLCPVDGTVSQARNIDGDQVFQAKGQSYSLTQLLGGRAETSRPFDNGLFTTLYLSPRDYHRIHMPVAGTLREVIHVPGKLFSVNPVTTRRVPGLFARNERVVCLFDTDCGPMAMVLVGAIFVASIETVWQGVITPPAGKEIRRWDYSDKGIRLKAGEEMGRFNMGSTVIIAFAHDRVRWEENISEGTPVRFGQRLGSIVE